MTIEMSTVTVNLRNYNDPDGETCRVVVSAEPTATPGLVITPLLEGETAGFAGKFTITHAASGGYLPIPDGWNADLDDLRRIAKALGGLPVDWTAGKEAVRAQCQEHRDAYREAVRAARYPAPEPDGPDAPKGEGPGPYPKTEAQATADAICRHLVRGLQYKCVETWDLLKRKDDDGMRVYMQHSEAKVADFGLVAALRAFAAVDQEAADHTAREIWQSWEAGSDIYSWVYEWAQEYGLPDVERDSDEEKEGQPAEV